jgi:hypothetical protein
MGFVVKRPSRMQGNVSFEVGRAQATVFGWVPKFLKELWGVASTWI